MVGLVQWRGFRRGWRLFWSNWVAGTECCSLVITGLAVCYENSALGVASNLLPLCYCATIIRRYNLLHVCQ
jgi:hypothetical protein